MESEHIIHSKTENFSKTSRYFPQFTKINKAKFAIADNDFFIPNINMDSRTQLSN